MSENIRYEESEKHSFSLIVILKYVLIAAILLFVILMFRQNGDSDALFSDVSAALEDCIDTDALQEADDQTLKKYFGLNAADYDGAMLYEATYNMSAEELLLIRVSDESQLTEVKSAMEERIENRMNDFAGYLPEQEKLLEDAVIITRGSYIIMIVSADCEEYRQAFRRAL